MYLSKRRLIWHGVFLFLLGLLTGLVGEHFTNARLGLAAHLEGVMNGILLIALGGIWQEVRLSATSTKATFWLLLYGAYSNWLVTTMAAILGTSSMTPIAAAGRCEPVVGCSQLEVECDENCGDLCARLRIASILLLDDWPHDTFEI